MLAPWKKSFDKPRSESEVAQSCPTLCDPMDCSPPGSSAHGILQARILEWVAISFSRGSSRPRDQTQLSHIAGRHFNLWATREDKPRQCIKKQRDHFANKGPYGQSSGFSSSQVQMWELNHKEGWLLKNWCFWIVVLEKTFETILDWKEIKLVNLKGNQPWIFIGRTDAEDEAPVLWPPDANSWLFGKDPGAGKDWGLEEKGATENDMVECHYQLNGHEFERTLGDSEGQGSLVCCSP